MNIIQNYRKHNDFIRMAISQRCRVERDWTDVEKSTPLQWFYTIKTLICILFDWYTFEYTDLEERIDVAAFDYVRGTFGEYSGAEWNVLCVGRGFFYGWQYAIYSDGYP